MGFLSQPGDWIVTKFNRNMAARGKLVHIGNHGTTNTFSPSMRTEHTLAIGGSYAAPTKK
jgi:hypothetical protein